MLAITGPLMAVSAPAGGPAGDSLVWYRAVAQMGKLYQQKPVQLNITIRRSSLPARRVDDSTQTELTLYIGEHDYYLSSEGLEMIMNDSLSLMVNHPGRRMMLYSNRQSVNEQLFGALTALAADSSVQQLAQTYRVNREELPDQQELIRLTSRQQLPETGFAVQTLWLIRKIGSADPVTYGVKKTTLLPVDSAVWSAWQSNAAYAGKLMRVAQQGNSWLYCLVREETTTYSFTAIRHNVQKPPVVLADRLQPANGGQPFVPAKGYEEYLFTKEE